MTSGKPVVSFCIPVYNNAEAAELIVRGILRSESTRFEVVVSDDASSDDAEERLSKIHDERFRYFRNAKNLGAHKNWEHSLELGSGEYLYLVMGRDRILGEHIGRLIELLERARVNNVTLIEDGYTEGRDMRIYDGMDAMIRFVRMFHPTGTIFDRKLFHDIPNRTRYFEISDMYPENYVRRDMLLHGKGASIMSGVFHYENEVLGSADVLSTIESGKSMHDMYYSPERRTKQTLEILDMVDLDLAGKFSEADLNRFFKANFSTLLNSVSFVWWYRCVSPEWQGHYGQKIMNVSLRDMLKNIFTAHDSVLKHLHEKGTYTKARHRIMYMCMMKYFILVPLRRFSQPLLENFGVWEFLRRIRNRIRA